MHLGRMRTARSVLLVLLGSLAVGTAFMPLTARPASALAAYRTGSGTVVASTPRPQDAWKKSLMDDEGLDIDAIIEDNKQKLPEMPTGPRLMKGLKGGPLNDEEAIKNRQNTRLAEWLAENGVHMSDRSGWGVPPHPLLLATKTMDEVELEDSGRGLICKDPINMGNPLFQLPLKIVIDKEKALEVFAGALPEDINEYFAIALLLIREKSLGPASFFQPYIDVLPTKEEVNPTLIWSDADLALLEGSSLVAATQSLKKKLQAEYAMLKEKYMDPRPDLFDPQVYTFDNYLWAFINIFSRAIRVKLQRGETIIMCPYADLINHNPYANTYIEAERPFKPFNPIRGDEVITIYADKDYKKMEQVYISYGPKSNADLLLLYGFCLDRNPFNSVEIKVSLTPSDPLYEMKAKFLASAERREAEAFPLYADRFPNELFEYLRLVYLTPEDLAGRALEDIPFADPINMENELSVLASIEAACTEGLGLYSTTEEEDAKLINDPKLFNMFGKTQRMAIKHRRSEKRLLKKTAAAVRQQQLNLKSGKRSLYPPEE